MILVLAFALLLVISSTGGVATAFVGGPSWQWRRKVTTALPCSQQQHEHVDAQSWQQHCHHIGLPPILQQLEHGDSLVGYRTLEDGQRHNVTVERIAVFPPVFVLTNVVTPDECDSILSAVSTMEPAQTASGLQEETTRKFSFVTWLGNDAANGVVGRLADAMRGMMLTPHEQEFMGVEDLQVLRYDSGGEYVLHHDGNDRILTVLYYLNGEGETHFPLAQFSDKVTVQPQTRQEALDLARGLRPYTDGVTVSSRCSTRTNSFVPVSRGDAVAFYSYESKDGTMDWTAIHAGLPARNEKFVANHFFRHASLASKQQ